MNRKNNDINSKTKIAIIGLGYVGLPLARLFATKYPVIGFDINQGRVDELNIGHDSTLEVEDDILQSVLVTEASDQKGWSSITCFEDVKSYNFLALQAMS